jgi:glycosyltransferase involved in cell wall biosynthesis
VTEVVTGPRPAGGVVAAIRRIAIVPAFNEQESVTRVIEEIRAFDRDFEIVVVDDGSSDGTARAVADWAGERRDVVLVRQPRNIGKGAAIRAGLDHVDGDIVVIQDADLEYDPAEVPSLIEPIERGVADVVYGSRLSGGRPQRAYLFWHMVGNRFLSLVTGLLYNTTLSDMETGYKAFRTDVIQSLPLRECRFGIEPELTAQVCKRQLRIYELPISYYGRTYDEGKKITWRDGFRALWVLVRVRLTP